MITDWLLWPLLATVEWAVNSLPDGEPIDVPGVSTLALWIARVDSLIPISEPLGAAMGVLSAVVLFVAARLVLTAWNLVWP